MIVMTRAEKIIEEAEEFAAKAAKYDNRQSFLIGWLKTEIKHLCKEVEILEARCANQNLTNPDA